MFFSATLNLVPFYILLLQTTFSYIIRNGNDITMVEDVLGAYELKSLRNAVTSTGINLKKHMNQVAKNISVKNDLNSLQKDERNHYLVLQHSIDDLEKGFTQLKNGMEKKTFDIEKTEEKISSRIINKLSEIKDFFVDKLEHYWSSLKGTIKASSAVLALDCYDLNKLGFNASGSYWLQKFGRQVLCDMETEEGGWLLVQRRAKVDEQVDFNQNWFGYKIGFGNLDTEFWIGNDMLHILTNQRTYEMRIEMEDYEKGYFYAAYSSFRVGNERSQYALDVGNYTGNCTDGFAYHHRQTFTTKDRDSDAYEAGNCASYFFGGWWYDRCYNVHLNGIYPDPPDRENASYITWWAKFPGEEKVPLVLTNVVIKIRPTDFEAN